MRSLPTGLTTEFDLLSTTEDLQKLIHRKNGTVYGVRRVRALTMKQKNEHSIYHMSHSLP